MSYITGRSDKWEWSTRGHLGHKLYNTIRLYNVILSSTLRSPLICAQHTPRLTTTMWDDTYRNMYVHIYTRQHHLPLIVMNNFTITHTEKHLFTLTRNTLFYNLHPAYAAIVLKKKSSLMQYFSFLDTIFSLVATSKPVTCWTMFTCN